MRRPRRECAGLACAGLLAALPAVAGSAPDDADYYPPPLPVASPISDHFALQLGYLWDSVTTYARVDSSAGVPGTALTAERDLGLTDRDRQLSAELNFRIGSRSRVRIDFEDVRRAGSKVIDQTIDFGNQTFAVDSLVDSEIDWRQFDLTYTYSFLRREQFELGAGIGVHALQAFASGQVPMTSQLSQLSGSAPFATLAVDGTWRFAKRWSLNARAQYMRVTIRSYSGSLADYHGDLQYRWQRNLAAGVAYESQTTELDSRHGNPAGEVRLGLKGPQLFVRVSF